MEDTITDLTRLILLNPTNKDLCKHLRKRIKALKESILTGGTREDRIRLIEDVITLTQEIENRLLRERLEGK
ncbi:hypothetical protein KAR91_28590 [Candidatus Pacearchaeota archaeon]|nr:hypothetical protein [Candidatus Pacearchaeota archaeon]